MNPIKYSVDHEIFEMFPGYCRGLLFISDIELPKNPLTIDFFMKQLREVSMPVDSALHIEAWKSAFRRIGIDPTKSRPSVDALIRRHNGGGLPSINALVDLTNALSVYFGLPVGLHPIDVINEDIHLGIAAGNEKFQPFGIGQEETPDQGEIILRAGNEVLTRRWVWRQSQNSIVTGGEKKLVLNIDVLPPFGIKDVELVAKLGAEMIRALTFARTTFVSINASCNSVEIADL